MTRTVTRTRATRLEEVMVMVPSTLALAPNLEAGHGELLHYSGDITDISCILLQYLVGARVEDQIHIYIQ